MVAYNFAGAETEHIGSSLPHSSLEKSVLPLTSPTYKMASKSHSTQDATDGRWRRYRRDALIDPRKILLLFATLYETYSIAFSNIIEADIKIGHGKAKQ